MNLCKKYMPKFHERDQHAKTLTTKQLHIYTLVHLGTWTDLTWEVGLFLLGNLDRFINPLSSRLAQQ